LILGVNIAFSIIFVLAFGGGWNREMDFTNYFTENPPRRVDVVVTEGSGMPHQVDNRAVPVVEGVQVVVPLTEGDRMQHLEEGGDKIVQVSDDEKQPPRVPTVGAEFLFWILVCMTLRGYIFI
jgi:hypothetical protein